MGLLYGLGLNNLRESIEPPWRLLSRLSLSSPRYHPCSALLCYLLNIHNKKTTTNRLVPFTIPHTETATILLLLRTAKTTFTHNGFLFPLLFEVLVLFRRRYMHYYFHNNITNCRNIFIEKRMLIFQWTKSYPSHLMCVVTTRKRSASLSQRFRHMIVIFWIGTSNNHQSCVSGGNYSQLEKGQYYCVMMDWLDGGKSINAKGGANNFFQRGKIAAAELASSAWCRAQHKIRITKHQPNYSYFASMKHINVIRSPTHQRFMNPYILLSRSKTGSSWFVFKHIPLRIRDSLSNK